ncbi:hypothetical protein CDIK_0537 [Cucumispora dikerogammari]|nr:hypothetical protein CDIK_0537 [Cucumispora dikerogammari]
MEFLKTISKICQNQAAMSVTWHYFFIMLAIYCVQDFYFLILKDIVNQDSSKAILLNLSAVLGFPISLTIAVLTKIFKDHRPVLVVQMLLYIASLIIECCIYKSINWPLAIVSSVLYNIGQGTVFTTLDLMKINSLSRIGSLHLVSVVSIGASLGQMGGLAVGIVLSYFETDVKEMRQKLRFASLIFSIICLYIIINFSPKCDYSDKSTKQEEESKEIKTGTNIKDVLKLLITPSFIVFISGLLLQCAAQKNIKLFQRDYIIKMGASEVGASIGQFFNRGVSIICYTGVIYITTEKMIFNYFLISCLFCTLRSLFFLYIGKQGKFTSKQQLILIGIFSIEDGFQNLSISRICNYLSSAHIKVYALGIFTGTKNSLSIVLSTLISKMINKNNKDMTKETYWRIWITMSAIAAISFVFSIILLILKRKK